MRDWLGHFEAVALYGLAPLVVISAVNLVLATAIARATDVTAAHARLLGLSFGTIGITVGLLMGASRDSVVGTVVPAILTFLSGFTVYQFGKDAYEHWRPALPIGLTCLMVGTICAATFGASQRNSYIDNVRRYEEWRLQYEKLELPLRIKQLEKQLGVTVDKPKKDDK